MNNYDKIPATPFNRRRMELAHFEEILKFTEDNGLHVVGFLLGASAPAPVESAVSIAPGFLPAQAEAAGAMTPADTMLMLRHLMAKFIMANPDDMVKRGRTINLSNNLRPEN